MQLKLHMVTIDDLMPQEHFLRKLEAALDLSFVYEETTHLYSRKYGRPPIDPVVLVKYLLVGFLYGIPSERQIEERCRDSNALRWYLGIDLDERVPDHSTISQLRRRKPGFRKIFRRLFEEVVRQCVEQGLVSGRLAVTDSTHVKANAARASEYEVDVQAEAGNYKRHPRKKVSHTDPEAGYMARPGKPNGFYYLSHQTTDPDWGIITAVTVTPGDVHDSQPYLEQMEYVHKNVIPIQAAAADSAYDLPLAHRVLEELGIDFFVVPQPAHDRTKAEFKRDVFTYHGQRDVYLCPNGKELRPKRLYRSDSGLFWEYWANRRDCACGKMPERDGQGGGAEAVGQLFQTLRPAVFLQAMGAGVPGGAEEAADLV